MNLNSTVPNCKEIAQSIKGQKPPYRCPICQKEYKSITGIFYHIGQFGPPTAAPRCLTSEEVSQGSPHSYPSSPSGPMCTSSIRRKARRELTWGEAQRLVEVEFDSTYRRVEIDNDLEISDEEKHSTTEEIAGRVTPAVRRKRGGTPRIQQKRGRGATKGAENETSTRSGGGSGKPAKLSSTVKDKCKRRSKLKSGKGDPIALPMAEVNIVESLDFPDAPIRESSYFRFVEQSAEDLDENIEYDMDEEDYQWLSLMNEDRKGQGLTSVPQDVFEILMDRLEKECVFESQTFGDSTDKSGKNIYNIDENAVCCICNDGECHNTNAILFCDMCNLAIHQECYGVPYIPEGQWLCRRCIESPSRGVDCALCPNKGGAFKQTLDTRWAHVICAIWIPEVQFSNPVFLEPIDGINEIPPARWKLTCYICRRRMGACIQCAKANCYVAFHVTCAQQASLYMKLEPTKGGEVKKTAFCDVHTPLSFKRKLEKEMREQEISEALDERTAGEEEEIMVTNGEGDGENEGVGGDAVKLDTTEAVGKKKVEEVDISVIEPRDGKEGREEKCISDEDGEKEVPRLHRVVSSSVIKARKMMEERIGYSNVPVVNIPYVPQHRLGHIIAQVNVMKKSQFVPKLVSYWKLKRQSRNGVPLLRRLQANKGQRATTMNLTEKERGILVDQLALWNSLRHDLERARLLIELVRKREKLKREKLRLLMTIGELQLRPLNLILRKSLERIARKDPAAIFANPVTVKDVPDYLDIIRKPMDFLTMANKVEANTYSCLEDFEKDFKLVWHNATIYNQKDTIYYKAAIRVKEAGQRVMEQAKLQVASANIHTKTGLHQPEVEEPPLPPPVTPTINITPSHTSFSNPISSIDILELNDDNLLDSLRERRCSTTSQVSLDEQIDVLQEKLQMIQSQPGYASRRKEKTLRKELTAVRRQIRSERKISETEDHSSVGSPRRHRAASIPRNAEELACHLIHGSLRFTPSRQQILSYSGIRLEDRASAMRKIRDKEEKDMANRALEKERIRIHSSMDSTVLLRSSKAEAHGGRVRVRMRSSDVLAASVSNEDEENRSALSNEIEDTGNKKWKLSERGREEVVDSRESRKKKKKKKKKKTRHKDWQKGERETCNSTTITVSSDSPFTISSQSKLGEKNVSAEAKSARREKSRCYVVSLNKSFKCNKNVRKASVVDGGDDEGEDEDEVSSLSIGQARHKSHRKVTESPAQAKVLPKQLMHHQTRLRSETLNAESEVEGSAMEVKRMNGNNDIRPRKSERLNPLKSPSHDGFGLGMTLIGRRMRTRSKSSSIYETAGEPDNSAAEEEEDERRRRRKRKRSPCFSDTEVREEVFSEELTSPPTASSFKDLTVLHVNDDESGCGHGRRRHEHKRKQSQSSDDPFISGKKQRMNSESSDRAKGVVLNGMVVNGEGGRARVVSGGGGLDIRPMELIWAKCCGYPPYPALVIDPDIPDSGINAQGEHILPPSDEVMELKEKNPTHTYLVRFFDGRRTWQWLPPEKIELLGVSQEKDNAKISMAGSSKRSVKEAYARAKHWQQRKARRSARGGLSKRSSTIDSELSSHNTGDPDAHSDVNLDLEA